MRTCSSVVYEFLNNASVAALFAVLLAAYLANKGYRRQKDIDRRIEINKEITADINQLQEKANYVLLIMNRMAHTYAQQKKGSEKDRLEFLEMVSKYEVPRLSDAINEEIPSILIKLSSKIQLYYKEDIKVNEKFEEFKKELKKWHDVVLYLNFSPTQSTNTQEKLSLSSVERTVKELVDLLWSRK